VHQLGLHRNEQYSTSRPWTGRLFLTLRRQWGLAAQSRARRSPKKRRQNWTTVQETGKMESRCALFQVKTVKRGAHMKRRILLVDDEVAVLLTLKAVLEISGFDVDTAASAREGKSKLRAREYDMVITDMRMESDSSGVEVIAAARAAACKPAIALLTAFPVNDESWQEGGADKLLVKPTQTRVLLQQIEQLFLLRDARQASGVATPTPVASPATVLVNGNAASSKKPVAKKAVTNKASSATKSPASTAARKSIEKAAVFVKAVKKSTKSAATKSAVKR